MRATRLRSAACATLVAGIGALVLPAAPAAAACTTSTAPFTVEEQRLESQAVPGQILAASGFDAPVTAFAAALCATTSYTQATQVVTTHAGQLWEAAVDRAQAGPPAGGQLAADDDRPLYWARLGMTRALRSRSLSPHGGTWVGMPGGDLHIAQAHAGIQHGRHVCMSEHVRMPSAVSGSRPWRPGA